MVTVYKFLEERGAEKMLEDERIEIATRAISEWDGPGSKKKSRHEIRQEVQQKEYAVKKLARQYSNSKIDEEEIKWCLYSIGDNNSFLLFNRTPVFFLLFILFLFFIYYFLFIIYYFFFLFFSLSFYFFFLTILFLIIF